MSALIPHGFRLLMTADAVGGVWQYATDLAAGLPDAIKVTLEAA